MSDQRERDIAVMEGEMNSAEDAFFAARPDQDGLGNRDMFRAGFKRAWWSQAAQPPAQAIPRDLLRWLKAQADDENANHRFRELYALVTAQAEPLPDTPKCDGEGFSLGHDDEDSDDE